MRHLKYIILYILCTFAFSNFLKMFFDNTT